MNDRPAILRPRALEPGVRVALVAPAGPVDSARMEASADRCRELGLEPVVMPSAGRRHGFLAGTDEERLRDLQAAFDDPGIRGVWALRGGYGTLRLLDGLDLGRQLLDPVPFIGFSDNTALHARHAAMGVVSFHGPHPGGAMPPETEAWLRHVLWRSDEAPGVVPLRDQDPPPRGLVGGRAEGRLFGGNLALMAALCGSAEGRAYGGRILLLEDIGEPAYRVDRMLVQLVRAGVTRDVAGLAFGRFTGGDDAEAEAVADVLEAFAGELGVPAVRDLPFGHVDHNCVLPLGAMARLDADAATLALTEPAVAS